MGHAAEHPAQRRSLQRPAESDPLSVELDGEDQRDEQKGDAAKPGELREARGVVRGVAF